MASIKQVIIDAHYEMCVLSGSPGLENFELFEADSKIFMRYEMNHHLAVLERFLGHPVLS